MAKKTDVDLLIKKRPTKDEEGFKLVTASNGKNYYYRYFHGNEGNDDGSNSFKVDKKAKDFTCTFFDPESYPDYRFVNFYDKNDSKQLTGRIYQKGRLVKIKNKNTKPGTFNWGVKVELETGVTVDCDPPVRNRN
ncbi:MAG: hypothetical protein ABJL54_02880 [Halioglobus sp.]|jgi:hypothetical protein